MFLDHNLSACLADDDGNKINACSHEAKISLLQPHVKALCQARQQETLPHLSLPFKTDDLEAIAAAAAFLRDGSSDVFVLGTGGSSLGAQTLAQVSGWQVAGCLREAAPRLHFLDNLDPASFADILEKLDLKTTKIFAVSKSGGTAEIILQTLVFISAYIEAGLENEISDHFLGLSEPRVAGVKNALRDVLEPYGVTFHSHDPLLGGRFTALSNVGLIPAVMLGVDALEVRRGAASVLAHVCGEQWRTASPVQGAALNAAYMLHRPETNINVLWAYADGLRRLTAWHVQLWAESLGKAGKGTTPLAAVGPVDQHSQQQLYLDGPRDKLVTMIETNALGKGPKVNAALASKLGAMAYAGKSVGDLVSCLQRATAETMINHGLPVRRIHIGEVGAASVGALLMHFMLETIFTAALIGVDPFDQPAVEEGKVLARQYLADL